MAKALLLLPLLAAADGIATDGIHEALDQDGAWKVDESQGACRCETVVSEDDTCSDPSCALGLLHVRGNATSEGPEMQCLA